MNFPYSLKRKWLIDHVSGEVTVQYSYLCASGIKGGRLRLEEWGRIQVYMGLDSRSVALKLVIVNMLSCFPCLPLPEELAPSRMPWEEGESRGREGGRDGGCYKSTVPLLVHCATTTMTNMHLATCPCLRAI